MSFNVGDIVKLKSGGPNMTITRIGTSAEEPMVWCTWFEGTKDTYGIFPPAALVASSELAMTRKASEESQPTEADGDKPQPVEASQRARPKQPDGVPVAKSDVETQIASIQSMISGLLKRS